MVNTPNAGESIDEVQLATLQRLLSILGLQRELAQAIADWLDPDQEPRFPDGAEDGEYVTYTPPYLAANRPFLSLSELRLIKGIDKEIYAQLTPYLCTLPPGTSLNVNTALPPVLAALSDDIGLPRAENLVEARDRENQTGYDSVASFLSALDIKEETFAMVPLAVSSHYFLLQAEAQVGEGRALLRSIIHRADSGNVRILLRRFGNDD
jgi:general secretion pathway protein K